MILFKYKPVRPLQYLIDVLLHERLYSAPYTELNDPFEGQFIGILRFSGLSQVLAGLKPTIPMDKPRILRRPQTIDDLFIQAHQQRVCSLSATSSDVRMWSLYASGHTGVVFEVDLPESDLQVRQVSYSKSLQEWSDTLLTSPSSADVLSHKTDHWEYEEEHRIITDSEFVSIHGCLKRVLVGARASDDLEGVIRKLAPRGVEIVRMQLNHAGATVRAESTGEP